MTYPLVSELADAGIPVTVSCRVLKLARQPYYRWRNDPIREADVLRAYRINALHDAHHDDPTFGYRYLADEARRAGLMALSEYPQSCYSKFLRSRGNASAGSCRSWRGGVRRLRWRGGGAGRRRRQG